MAARKISAQSQTLRTHAQDIARRIVARVPCSVALTGSAARGDAERGSDIDLWVVGPPQARETFDDGGQAVTLICQPLRAALTFRNLCYWEVRDLLVLEDRTGAFKKIQGRFKKHAARIDKAVLEATFDAVNEALRNASSSDALHQVRALRAATHRLAAAQVFRQSKQRVPRVRQLKAQLPPKAWTAYQRAMGFSNAERIVRTALREWPKLGYPEEAGDPLQEAAEKLGAGRGADALLIVRRHFDLGVPGARPRPEVLRYGELIHDVTERTSSQVVASFATLCRELKLRSLAPKKTLGLIKRVGVEL